MPSRIALLTLFLLVSQLPAYALAERDSHSDDAIRTSLCLYNKGDTDTLIVGSSLLLTNTILEDGAVAILASGRIGQVGKFTELTEAMPGASLLDCRNKTVLSPGWVNIHEHEAFSYAYPDPNLKPIYRHREEWIYGRNGMPALPVPKSLMEIPADETRRALLSWVELRHLIAGTTTLGGLGAIPGLAKNINRHADPADSASYPYEAELQTFPFSQNAIGAFANICDDGETLEPTLEYEPLEDLAFVPHIGEGRKTDCTARAEIDTFLSYVAQEKNTRRRFSAVHAVAAGPENLAEFSKLDVTLVWSPRSNLALYGETIDLEESIRQNVRLALGTDWSPSGSFNMLEEFTCAQSVSQNLADGLDAYQLWLMATHNAAYAVGLEDVVGQIREGMQADLVLIRRMDDRKDYDAAISAGVEDIQMVWVDGAPIITDAAIARSMNIHDECVALNTDDKVACIDFETLGINWDQLVTLTQDAVPISGNTMGQAPCGKDENTD